MRRSVFLGGLIALVACETTNKKWTECMKCPPIDIVDFHEAPEDPRDRLAIKRAITVCAKDNKCLVRFYRFEPGDYHAICGVKEKSRCISK